MTWFIGLLVRLCAHMYGIWTVLLLLCILTACTAVVYGKEVSTDLKIWRADNSQNERVRDENKKKNICM